MAPTTRGGPQDRPGAIALGQLSEGDPDPRGSVRGALDRPIQVADVPDLGGVLKQLLVHPPHDVEQRQSGIEAVWVGTATDRVEVRILHLAKPVPPGPKPRPQEGQACHGGMRLRMTVPGVGWVLAYTIGSEIGDIRRFASQ